MGESGPTGRGGEARVAPAAPGTTVSAVTRRTPALLVGVLALAAVAGCSSSGPAAGSPAIPSFPGPGAAPVTSAPPARNTLLPTDCDQVLSKEVLPNLLGLPLGSTTVTALRDVPAPNVGRLERVTCNYTSTGGPAAPPQNALVLKVLSSGYTTAQAATAQAQANTQVEESSGVAAVPTPIGTAQATYYDDPDGPLLVVVYGRVTSSLTLGVTPVGRDQARSVLVDLAQRVLPVLVPAGAP